MEEQTKELKCVWSHARLTITRKEMLQKLAKLYDCSESHVIDKLIRERYNLEIFKS